MERPEPFAKSSKNNQSFPDAADAVCCIQKKQSDLTVKAAQGRE
jgi:hypothetical protein